MKKLNFLIAIFISLALAGCGNSDKTDTTSNDSDKKTNTEKTSNTNTNNNSSNNTSGGVMLSPVSDIKEPSKGMAPDFSWDENGEKMSLSALKGKVVLLNMWATWCGPCIKEMPDLSEISEELEGKDFKMLGLNVLQQPGSKPVDEFLKEKPVSYWIVDGNDELVSAFEKGTGETVEGIPTTFIIDKEGKIVETIVGMRSKADFMSTINKYIN